MIFGLAGKTVSCKIETIEFPESRHVNLYHEDGSFTTSRFPDPTRLLILIVSVIVAVTHQ